MFEPFNGTPDFPSEELKVLEFWESQDTFRKSCDQRLGGKEFVFYDGPPFATGLPHHGHLLVSTIKDVVARYATMRGHHVRRRFGWDCHGLPIEYEIEKSLGISGKQEIEEFGIDKFNDTCRSIVDRYSGEWRKTIARLGRWVDFEDEYRTMDPEFMESVWWVFNELWNKDLIYQGHRIQPYCPRCTTPLSNFETNQGYADRQDPSVTVTCPVVDDGPVLLVWTTTPWTLPSNTAVCVGPDLEYDFVHHEGTTYIVASSRRVVYFGEDSTVEKTVKGSELAGLKYQPLFDFFTDQATDNTFTVVVDDYVSAADGTGLVHQAPAFGEDDFRVAEREGLPIFDPFNAEVIFQEPVTTFKGLQAKEADPKIIANLKERNRMYRHDTLNHSYPHCWRCDDPLIYRALSAWFLNIDKVKQQMLTANSNIHWVPNHIKSGRFGQWLENARDWNLSRNRYWGSAIPVWICDSCDHRHCIGSRAELTKLSGIPLNDLHKEFVDKITFGCSQCDGTMHRTPEVLDCWFESGSMPYAQLHYPFAEKDYFENTFPADFITEAVDQTRGWFYSLTVLGAALFGKQAFNNVIVLGLLLAEDGKKMSKRKQNYTPPDNLMAEFGADAFRLGMINSAVVRGEAVRFGDDSVRESLRAVILPLTNACQFFLTYAKADGWTPADIDEPSPVELDRWILSRQQTLIKGIVNEMDQYQLDRMVPPLLEFLDELTNWYIRRSRRRFWKSDSDIDKIQAYRTLHHVLREFLKALAPVIPFTTDMLWQRVVRPPDDSEKSSVHLTDYPAADDNVIDLNLERRMAAARTAVNLGHMLRKEHKLKVRQPLRSLTLVARDEATRADFEQMRDLILDELNVKDLAFTTAESELVTVSTRPNFKTLGKRLGAKLKAFGPVLQKLTAEQISQLEAGESLELNGEHFSFEDILIDRKARDGAVVGTEDGVTIALDTELNDELLAEGHARELINRLQNLRKETGFEVSDRVHLTLCLPEILKSAFKAHQDLVCGEILATGHSFSDSNAGTFFDINGHQGSAGFEKVHANS